MRETATGTLFTWSKNRQFDCRFLSWPAPLCFFFVTTLFIEATRFGVSERIADESINSCGMLPNTFQSRRTKFSCVCDGINRTLCRGGVSNQAHCRLHFCTSIPLYKVLNASVLQNRTLCHELSKKLQEADKNANGSYKMFKEIIARMDCVEDDENNHTYSVTSTCQDCLDAYKNWACFTEVSDAILDVDELAHVWKRPCPRFCETVLQKCPYIPPVPNSGDSLVQVGYSAFNCLAREDWRHMYGDSEDQCVDVEPLQDDEPFKPTETTKGVQAMNSTTSSSTNSSKR